MAKAKALFNVNRLVAESGNDVSPEASFLFDFDYTSRKLNEWKPYAKFVEVTSESRPDVFDTSKSRVDVVCVDSLPIDLTLDNTYDKTHVLYHTSDQKYYIYEMLDGKPSRTYKPSSLHCIRNMYYQIIGADLDKQSQKSGDFYGICESGTDRHERIQFVVSKMKENGVDCEYLDVEEYVKEHQLDLEVLSKKKFETKLKDSKRNLIFLCDGLIRYKGKVYILEIKTESSFKWMSRNNYDIHHKLQASAYSLELGISDVLFVYENRDLCSKKVFHVVITDEDRKSVADKLTTCDEYVEKHITPPKPEGFTSKDCQYCDYKTVCRLEK